MNQKQKTLGEKAIKLRYNGMISQLCDCATTAEVENELLPVVNLTVNRDEELIWSNADHVLPQYEAAARNNEAFAIVLAELKQAITQVNNCIDLFERGVNRINEERSEVLEQAKAVRRRIVASLRSQRDEAILDLAFKDEGQEMEEFLKSLPTPEKMVELFKQHGLQLTTDLEAVTGIGESNPEALCDSTWKNRID